MIARRRAVAAAVLATAALSPVALAHGASLPTIDVWQGKTTKKHDGMFIANVRPRKAVQLQLSVRCETADGQRTVVSLTATGKLSGGRVNVTEKQADSGRPATLTIRAKLPKTAAATGTATWRIAASEAYKACSGTDSFKLKHSITHGG